MTATSTPTDAQSLEEWRAETKEKAQSELENGKLQVWVQGESSIDIQNKIFNGHPTEMLPDSLYEEPIISDDDPWAPLKDNVELTAVNSQDQATQYRRQEQTDSISADILTTVYLPQLINDGVSVMDLSDIPAWQKHVPKPLKQRTSKMAYYKQKPFGVFYNSKEVSEPPEDITDILEPRFSDKRIVLDPTPAPVAVLPFVGGEFADKVPPHLEAAGADMTGAEFADALSQQNPKFNDSSYGMTLDVANGDAAVTLGAPSTVMFSQQNEGLPIKPLKDPSGYVFQSGGMGVTADPPHPNAARLFIDYLLSKQAAQLFEEGMFTLDFAQSNPAEAREWMYADWQTSYSGFGMQGGSSKVISNWKSHFDVPNV